MRIRSLVVSLVAAALTTGALASPPMPSINLQIEDGEVREVLRDLARVFDVEIAIQPSVTGRISGDFEGRSLEEILSNLLPQVGAEHCVASRVVRVFESGTSGCVAGSRLRLPFVGPAGPRRVLRSPRAIGAQPLSARPDRLPYFGMRDPRMPNTHFMDPRMPAVQWPEPPR